MRGRYLRSIFLKFSVVMSLTDILLSDNYVTVYLRNNLISYIGVFTLSAVYFFQSKQLEENGFYSLRLNMLASTLILLLLLTISNINVLCIQLIHKNFNYRVLSSFLALSLTYTPISNSNAANDALDSALKAMTTTKERTIEDRSFAELPKASKKRKAIEYCKESDRRQNAGYKSASDCTAAVIEGDFSIASAPTKRPSSTTSSSTSSSTSSIATTKSSPALVEKAKSSVSKVEKVEKVEDLSDLSPPSLKRRSLAACKKASTRKFAGMGSESKCTENVLAGNYASIIEALEYGK